MKISERVGQLLDLSTHSFYTKKRVVALLSELNEEIPGIVMNSKDMSNNENYIKLYQDIKEIVGLINNGEHLNIMKKETNILTNNAIEKAFE